MPLTRKHTAAAAALLLSLAAARAEAGIVTYDLFDTPHGTYDDGGFYRFVGGNPRYQTYSFDHEEAGATLTYDDTANSVRIAGRGYNLSTGKTDSFGLFYDDLTRDGDRLTLNDMGIVGGFDTVAVRGKGFNLTLGDTLTGHGWLTDPATGRHFGDFHVGGRLRTTAGAVPAPGPLALLVAGLLFGIGRRGRR